MKKIILILAIVLLLFCFITFVSFAHSGGTDSNGGHTDSSTGEYHYHHGYPAHQHANGKCPYIDSKNESSSVLIIVLSVVFATIMTIGYVVLEGNMLPTKKWDTVFTWMFLASIFGYVICFMLKPIPAFISFAIVGVLAVGLYLLNKWIKEKKYKKQLEEQRGRSCDINKN